MNVEIAELSTQIESQSVAAVATADPDARIAVLAGLGITISLQGLRANLDDFETRWRTLLPSGTSQTAKDRAITDWQLADSLHRALRHLPRRTLLKPRFWEWLSLVATPEYVIARWVSDQNNFTNANCGRFLCSSGVAGIETNALARLYWTADVSWSTRGDYSGMDSLFEFRISTRQSSPTSSAINSDYASPMPTR